MMNGRWCHVWADKNKVRKAKKAWIPIPAPTAWTEENAAEVIKELEDDWKPKEVLRFSRMSGTANYLQLLIPKGMVGHDLLVHHTKGDLDFGAECKPISAWNTADQPEVNWRDGVFEENVKGDPQETRAI